MVIGFGFGTIVVIVLLVVMTSFRVLREYQRAVVFMLGRFWKVKGPGFFLLIPVVQQMVRIDLRTVVMDVPPQDVITRDNVSVKVNAVVYFRVVDPQKMDSSIKSLIRYGEPDEMADAVAFLAGPRSKYISGQVLRVDGGETLFPG